jgi:hypothetical protein
MLVEFSGQESHISVPEDPQGASYLIGDMLQVAERVKQRLLEITDAKARLRAEYDFLERLLPQLRKLLDRRRVELRERQENGEDLSYRTTQEQYFGKFFSQN